jgi:hypothetical protein
MPNNPEQSFAAQAMGCDTSALKIDLSRGLNVMVGAGRHPCLPLDNRPVAIPDLQPHHAAAPRR